MTYYFLPHKIQVVYELETQMFPLVVVFPRQNFAALFIAVLSGLFVITIDWLSVPVLGVLVNVAAKFDLKKLKVFNFFLVFIYIYFKCGYKKFLLSWHSTQQSCTHFSSAFRVVDWKWCIALFSFFELKFSIPFSASLH